MRLIHYDMNDVPLFDDLYDYFKNIISGKRVKTISIDDRLKAFARQHINNKQQKWSLNEFVNESRVW